MSGPVRARMRRAWAEIDVAAVSHNAAVLSELSAPAVLCAVVKADGYGAGAVTVARAALAGGARWLAVALVEEGLELRRAGIDAPVLVLSEPTGEAMAEAVGSGLTPTLYTPDGVASASAAASASAEDRPVEVHLKVDTGMHRVGADPDDLFDLAAAVARPPLALQGLWTHLAVAEDLESDFTAEQLSRFESLRRALASGGLAAPIHHAANSAGAIAHPASRYDLVRCGIALHGHIPAPAVAGALADAGAPPLRPVMSLRAEVSFVRRLPAGARPSYGRCRPLETGSTVATVPLGYADGVPRRLFESGAEVLVGGQRRRLAGAVTMDQIVVDCGDDQVRPGDEVVLIGRQGDETVSADEWAARLGTISYEVLCGIGARVPRIPVSAPL